MNVETAHRDFAGKPGRERFSGMSDGPGALDVAGLVRVVRRRIWTLVAATLIGTALVAAWALSATPLYTASGSLLINAARQPANDLEAVLSGIAASREIVANEAAVIVSKDFSWRVIHKLGLDANPDFNPFLAQPSLVAQAVSGAKSLAGLEEGPPLNETQEERDARVRSAIMSTYLARLTVMPRLNTTVLDVSMTTTSPELSARIVNTISELYLVEQLEASYQATKRATDWLSVRLGALRSELEGAENAVESYRSQAGLLEGGRDMTLVQQQVAEVNAQLLAAQARRSEAEERLRRADALSRSPYGAASAGEALASALVSGLITQETEIGRRIAELSSTAGSGHPAMKAARAEQNRVRAQIGTEIARIVQGLRNEAEVARAQEANLTARLRELETQLGGLNAKQGEMRILEREAEASRALYETFLGRFKQTEGQETRPREEARVISAATVPLRPSFPNTPMFIALGALGSLVLGLMIVGVREQLDRGIRSMEEVNRYLELPCLGLLPQVSKLQLAGRSLEDYPVRKPNSAYAEAVRSVETGILLSDRDVRPRVILLSSSRPNEGKTASAIALARLNALGGRRTILIDLDLRKPEVAQRLRLRKSHPGIADYLHGAARPESIIQRDEATGLDIIAAGRPQESTPELLRAGTLESLVTALRQEYDMILLDAPPVLAVSDTRLIARLADKTVFVVRWAETPRDVARLALRQLADGGADIAGVVISLVDIRRNQRFGFSDSESYGGVYRRYYQS